MSAGSPAQGQGTARSAHTGDALALGGTRAPAHRTANLALSPGDELTNCGSIWTAIGLWCRHVNAQNGRYVYGLEADLQWGRIKGTGSTAFQLDINNPDQGLFVGNASLTQKLDWFSTLRGRIGYDFNPLLVCLTGGLAVGHIKSTLSLTGTTYDAGGGVVFVANTDSSASSSKTRIGYALGAGVETPLSPGWTLRGEYLFLSFDQSTTLSVAGATATTSGLDVHLVRAGINYKFGGPVVAKY